MERLDSFRHLHFTGNYSLNICFMEIHHCPRYHELEFNNIYKPRKEWGRKRKHLRFCQISHPWKPLVQHMNLQFRKVPTSVSEKNTNNLAILISPKQKMASGILWTSCQLLQWLVNAVGDCESCNAYRMTASTCSMTYLGAQHEPRAELALLC